MSLRSRFYLIDAQAKLWRIPKHLVEDLTFGACVFALASVHWKVIEALAEFSGGKYQQVVRISGTTWHFDDKGTIVNGLIAAAIQNLESVHFARNKFDKEVSDIYWMVSPTLRQLISDDLSAAAPAERRIRILKLRIKLLTRDT